MEELILRILTELCPYEDITPETELLEEGLLDSMSIEVLLERLESELHITIPTETLDPADFEDVSAIAQLAERNM